MRLNISCQICGKILATIEKPEAFTQDDIDMYETSVSCDTVQEDGITLDGQTDIQATKMVT